MPTAWHTKRWWDFGMSEDEKKEIEPIIAEGLQKCASVVQYLAWVIETFLPLAPKIYQNFGLYQLFMYNFYAKLNKII